MERNKDWGKQTTFALKESFIFCKWAGFSTKREQFTYLSLSYVWVKLIEMCFRTHKEPAFGENRKKVARSKFYF